MIRSAIFATLLTTLTFAGEKGYITIGSDTMDLVNQQFSSFIGESIGQGEKTLLHINESEIPALSEMIHENFHRCGGFLYHETKADALAALDNDENEYLGSFGIFNDYTITENKLVSSFIEQVREEEITKTITKLSDFHNRYYQSKTGVEAVNWIKERWEELSANRSDSKVELFTHKRWKQPSVIMTIEGSESPEDVLIIGGHADSIAGFFGRGSARAPGADDNASGIATITEVIRIAMDNSYRPKKTIKFMGYAAEEVGLRGSQEIASKFKKEGKNVIGVMQLDMTNHKGNKELDIVMMSDFTNKAQNQFIGKVIDTYVNVPWGYDKCGYACSDHASWHKNGFPASMPFETTFKGINKKIHTAHDTLANTRGNSNHAEKFAKMALAFMVEMAK